MRGKSRWLVIGCGIVLYLAALALPSCGSIIRGDDSSYSGLTAFRIGFRALTSLELTDPWWWIMSAAWLANPAIGVSLIAVGSGRWRIAGIFAAVGLVLSLQVLPWFGAFVPGHPGYWVWCGTAAWLLGASVWFGFFRIGTGTPLLKIRKADDCLDAYWQASEQSPNGFVEPTAKRQAFFLAGTWQRILGFCHLRKNEKPRGAGD